VLAIVVKEFRELRRDRRTLAMLVGMPLVLLVVFGYAANFAPNNLRVDVEGPGAAQVAAALPRALFDVRQVEAAAGPPAAARAVRDRLRAGVADVVLVTAADGVVDHPGGAATSGPGTAVTATAGAAPAAPAAPVATAYIDGVNLFAAQRAVAAFAQSGGRVRSVVVFNPGLRTSWVMIPGLVGLILTFVGMVVTSIGLTREREAGTLDQLAVMPLRPSSVILGKIMPYFLIAAVDLAVVTTAGVLIFGVPFVGSPLVFAVAAAVFLLVVLGLGILVSTVSKRTGQAVQLAIMLMLPQALLCGLIFPLSSMAAGVRWIGYALPLTYFIAAAKGVMLRGAGIGDLWLPLTVLAGMATAVFTAAITRFRRDLAPRPHRRDGTSRGGAVDRDPATPPTSTAADRLTAAAGEPAGTAGGAP
jgi:ABC-2 type transport system permease protein